MKKTKYFLLGFSVAAIIFTNSGLWAADVLQNIKVTFSNMPIYVEGVKTSFSNKPMLYNGTTYLPMRAVAKALEKEVLYDTKTRSIYIYSEGNEPDIKDNKDDTPNLNQDDSQEFIINNISIGDDKEYVIHELGEPKRQDVSEYGFIWFIYNQDYSNYIQVGIKEDKVVALYTNSTNWESKEGITYGVSASSVKKIYGEPLTYIQKGNTRYYINRDEKESNTFLIDDVYTIIFYDTYNNQTVTSVFLIDKNTELSFKGFYGEASNELVEAYQYQIFDLSNAVRARNSLKPYIWDGLASKSSLLHSKDMAEHHFFEHTNLKGESPFERMINQGIEYSTAAENIAAGQSNAIYAHEGWMNSEGHRENILGEYQRLGVGVYFGGEYRLYYTQNFYTPRN